MVSFEIVSSGNQTSLIRLFLNLSTLDNLPDLDEALNQLPGRDYIAIEDLNIDAG